MFYQLKYKTTYILWIGITKSLSMSRNLVTGIYFFFYVLLSKNKGIKNLEIDLFYVFDTR